MPTHKQLQTMRKRATCRVAYMKQQEKRPSVTLSMMINIVPIWFDQSSLSTMLPTLLGSYLHAKVPFTCLLSGKKIERGVTAHRIIGTATVSLYTERAVTACILTRRVRIMEDITELMG